jgi:hypothetical protein
MEVISWMMSYNTIIKSNSFYDVKKGRAKTPEKTTHNRTVYAAPQAAWAAPHSSDLIFGNSSNCFLQGG